MKSVNPNIQPEAQRVLDYLESIRGTKIILGQHTQTIPQEELAHIKEVTGKLPALCGFELLAYSPNIRPDLSGEECMEEVRLARGTLRKAWDWAKLGGLITFTWHWFSPVGGNDKSFFSVNTDFSAEKAAQAGTPEILHSSTTLITWRGFFVRSATSISRFYGDHSTKLRATGSGGAAMVLSRARFSIESCLSVS